MSTQPEHDDPAALRQRLAELEQANARLQTELDTRTAELHQAQVQCARLTQQLSALAPDGEGTGITEFQQQYPLLKAVFDHSPSAIYIKDLQGCYLLINRHFEWLLKVDRAQVLGKTDTDLFPSEIAQGWRANDQQVVRSGMPQVVEETVPQEGNCVYLSVKFPIHDVQGTLYAVGGISTDATERQQMEEELRKFQRAVEQSPSSIVITDLQARIEYVNPQFTQLTGYTLEEVKGQNPSILQSGDTPRETFEDLWQTILAGKEWHGEFCNVKKSGERFWELSSVSPILNHDGNITHYVAVKEDITEHKQIEAALRRSHIELEERVARRTEALSQANSALQREIGERKRAEEALRKSTAVYRAMFEKNRAVQLLIDPQTGAIVDANRAACAFYGYSLTTLRTLSITDINTLPAAQVLEEMQRARSEQRLYFFFQHRLSSGDIRDVEVYSSPLEIEGRTLLYSILHDMTERKRAEATLRQSEEQFRAFFEQAPVAIGVSRSGTTLTVNPAYLHMFGYESPDEVVGHPITEQISPDEHRLIMERARRRSQGEAVETRFEMTGQRSDGTRFPIICNVTRVMLVDGQEASVAFFTDISEQKHAQEFIRQSAARAEALIRIANRLNAQLELDAVLHTICEETALVLHTGVVSVMLYDRQQDIMAPHALIGLPPDLASQFCAVPGDIVSRMIPSNSDVVVRPDMQQYTHLPNAPVIKAANLHTLIATHILREDELVGLLVAFSVGQERRLSDDETLLLEGIASQAAQAISNARLFATVQEERALLARRVEERTAELSVTNAELARALRTKDEFLANMSHELRTPLNTILGMSEALQEDVFGTLLPQQRNSMQMIEESGRHLLALINDILDLAKIEAGKADLQVGPVVLSDMCAASLRLVRQMAQKKRLTVQENLQDAALIVQADERRLKQILVNLLSNAVKFTPDGGKIGLEVFSDPAHATVHLAVWDTGIGIAPNYLDRLFKPFVQIDSSLSRHHEGTGLGLGLVARLTEMHGGSVAVQSKEGQGSRFTVSLPWDPEDIMLQQRASVKKQQPLASSSPTPSPPAPDRLILLAEDNEMTITLLSAYLQQQGYQIAVARNGEEAINTMRDLHPALVLMDIQMPRMDGLEAIRQIRASPNLASIPVVALTALALPGDRERCLKAGADEYLSKPVSLTSLRHVIETLLEQHAHSEADALQRY